MSAEGRIRRGFIYLLDVDTSSSATTGDKRKPKPVLVVQNDTGNAVAATTIVVGLSSHVPSHLYPFQVPLPASVLGRPGVIMCEQIYTVPIERLEAEPVAQCPADTIRAVERALSHSLGLSAETAVAAAATTMNAAPAAVPS